jgi:hypothetical protein
LGGDALNGYAANGHYFVVSHGVYRKVSKESWDWSRVHAVSVLVTHPLAIAATAYLVVFVLTEFLSVGMTNLRSTRDAQERINAVRASGPVRASAHGYGKVGQVYFTRTKLSVEVYSKGMVVHSQFLSPRAILAEEIQGFDVRSPLLIGESVAIRHTSGTSPTH